MEAHELEKLKKENKEKSEEEQKAEIADKLEFKKEKETLLAKLEGSKQLQFLKSLLERWIIGVTAAESVISGKELDKEEIQEIFDKINEIEEVKNVDKILPKNLRLTREEYENALDDDIARAAAISKLNSALEFMADQANPQGFWLFHTAFSFFSVLNHNLVLVQEHTIDIKRSLI